MLFSIGFAAWFYFTPWGANLRYLMADTLITTQHRYLAKYLIGSEELQKRVEKYNNQFDEMGDVKDLREVTVAPPAQTALRVEHIEGKGFQGYILYVQDPKMIRVVTTAVPGKGERVLSMAERTGALAGVNGGAFDDPNWNGNGFKPAGIVISGGEVLYNDHKPDQKLNVVGIDRNGVMVAGRYSQDELMKMGAREAVTFQPKFIVNGKGLVRNEADGWGIAPRTCMAQKKDGTLMFVVIDGRQPGYSMGATLYDVQNILLERGAVTAANLDGGSSTVLVKDNQIINRPSSQYGPRYLPTAFLIYEHPESVVVSNLWKGMDMKHFNSANR
ncbi:phosphodiester glycosidase family protein [Ferviditalea candida]|uniref:Phosphodiester glycosidase family protein n=1 Tax=Ferviditalea candida TaxID=3108399 RepID=A0ABU5ZPI1_9BACL|nr:phosphodiester glycosidase family protein [Paenibacillaceae bacterium T2]